MCLGVPGQLLSIEQDPLGMNMGEVSFAGIKKKVCLAYTPEAEVGDYVVVGDYQGYVQWLSRKDGAILGRVQVDSDGIEASPVAVGKRVYVYSRGGELACLEKAEQ